MAPGPARSDYHDSYRPDLASAPNRPDGLSALRRRLAKDGGGGHEDVDPRLTGWNRGFGAEATVHFQALIRAQLWLDGLGGGEDLGDEGLA